MIHSETIDLLITGGRVFDPGQNLDTVTDVAVSDGLVAQIGPGIDPPPGRQRRRCIKRLGRAGIDRPSHTRRRTVCARSEMTISTWSRTLRGFWEG